MSSKRFKAVVMMLAVLVLGSILLAACVRPGTPTGNTGGGSTATSTPSGGGGGGGSGNCANGTVQTGASTFMQSCVTVAKGASLKIAPVGTSLHLLDNGSWINGNQQLTKEPGAPNISNVTVSNAPVEIGPFTTAGTFHILCTVHPNMNLTVEVR